MIVFFLTYAILALLVVSMLRSISPQGRRVGFERMPSKSRVVPSRQYESPSLRYCTERHSAFDLA
jgi:hypothetical protein